MDNISPLESSGSLNDAPSLLPVRFVGIFCAVIWIATSIQNRDPLGVAVGLGVVADLVSPKPTASWRARSTPFVVAVSLSAPIVALAMIAALGLFREYAYGSMKLRRSIFTAALDATGLFLGMLAASVIAGSGVIAAGLGFVLTGSLIIVLAIVRSWVGNRFDRFEARWWVREFGRDLLLKITLAIVGAGVIAHGKAASLLVLIIPILYLAAKDARDRRWEQERRTMLQALCGMLQYAHPYTLSHMQRVADAAGRVGEELRLGPHHRQKLAEAALFHDIGKVAVDERILEKSEKLTDPEFQAVRMHPELGAEIIAAMSRDIPAVSWVLHHHERVDGTGYPFRLAGRAIPLESRIIAVIDAYDAMTDHQAEIHVRRYKTPVTSAQARLELRRCSGSQFDGRVVQAFERILEEDRV